jgi:hypothetical protein
VNATLTCEENRISLGVYVLDAITRDERASVDAHLSACTDCRSDLSELAGLPALLARVTQEDAAELADRDPVIPLSFSAVPDQSAVNPPALSATRNRWRTRRKPRIMLVGAAAAAVVALSAVGGGLLSSHLAQAGQAPTPGTALGPWRTAAGTNAADMHAVVRYRPMGWGTQVAVLVTGIPIHTQCSVEAITPNGTTSIAGSWTTDSNEGNVYYPAGTALSGSDLSKFVITVPGQAAIAIPI